MIFWQIFLTFYREIKGVIFRIIRIFLHQIKGVILTDFLWHFFLWNKSWNFDIFSVIWKIRKNHSSWITENSLFLFLFSKKGFRTSNLGFTKFVIFVYISIRITKTLKMVKIFRFPRHSWRFFSDIFPWILICNFDELIMTILREIHFVILTDCRKIEGEILTIFFLTFFR